jgi:hypothetical protein
MKTGMRPILYLPYLNHISLSSNENPIDAVRPPASYLADGASRTIKLLTTPLHTLPLLFLPLFEKFFFAQRLAVSMFSVGLMMPGIVLQITLIGIVAGKAAHDPPK